MERLKSNKILALCEFSLKIKFWYQNFREKIIYFDGIISTTYTVSSTGELKKIYVFLISPCFENYVSGSKEIS